MAKNMKLKTQRIEENKDKRPRAVAKYIRISPYKVRVVLDLIRGKSVTEAVAILENISKAGAEPIKGLRRTGTAAIELSWEYYYPGRPVPLGISLLAKHDIFDLSDPRVQPFEYAMQSLGQNRPDDPVWTELFAGRLDTEKMIGEGERILAWINARNYHLVRSMAFEAEIDGLKCICSNMPQGRSSFFDTLDGIKDYDVMINFYMNKKRRWNLSFYSAKKEVDVSKIAARFGGGGHKGAAGASSLTELPDFIVKAVQ